MVTVLGFWDFFWIAIIVGLVVGSRVAYSFFRPADRARLRRIEARVDLILARLGWEYTEHATPGELSEEVKALADDPRQKIAAIKLLREQTGLSIREAKDAVDAYIAGRR